MARLTFRERLRVAPLALAPLFAIPLGAQCDVVMSWEKYQANRHPAPYILRFEDPKSHVLGWLPPTTGAVFEVFENRVSNR